MIIISSPSGAGKTTLCKLLLANDPKMRLSVSVTTRPKRLSETEGVDYYFISESDFQLLIDSDELLEYAKVFDYHYGTQKQVVQKMLDQGYDVIFDVDWQGALQLYNYCREDIVSIFILPPSLTELENRLKKRAQDSEEVVQKRMKKAKGEISHYKEYDYVIINHDINESLRLLQEIITVERSKRVRLNKLDEFVEELLEA
ncbi:MAG: guanylate kinase [Sphingobacteriia bacterium]|nr:guanylate kinase [Sphingobacteriia bacterium]